MDTLRDYYKEQYDLYYNRYNAKSSALAHLTGTIMGVVKYSDIQTAEKKVLINGLIGAYKTYGIEMHESTQKEIEEILGEKSLAY